MHVINPFPILTAQLLGVGLEVFYFKAGSAPGSTSAKLVIGLNLFAWVAEMEWEL